MAMGSLPYISLFTCPNNKHSYPFLSSFSNQWISCSYLLTIFRDFFHLWVIVNLTIHILRALILFSYVLKIPSPGCGLSFNVVHRVYFLVEKFSSFNFFFSLEDLVKNILFKKKLFFKLYFSFTFACIFLSLAVGNLCTLCTWNVFFSYGKHHAQYHLLNMLTCNFICYMKSYKTYMSLHVWICFLAISFRRCILFAIIPIHTSLLLLQMSLTE